MNEKAEARAGALTPLHDTKSDALPARRGLYARLFAWMLARGDRADRRLYGERKRALFADLAPGDALLEIGAGAGANAAYFPEGLRWLAVEPNVHFHPYLRRAAEEHGLDLTLVPGAAEQLAVDDASVDAVVSTLVLCSIADQAGALAEIRRVLKPGGCFYFIEHVAAPRGTLLHGLQRALRIPWGWVADGCHPACETGTAIEAAGFANVRIARFDAPLGLVRPHLIGTALTAGGAEVPLPTPTR